MHNSLSWSLSVSFLYNVLYNGEFPGLGELVPESNTDGSWYYAVFLPRFVCLALLAQSSLYYENDEI